MKVAALLAGMIFLVATEGAYACAPDALGTARVMHVSGAGGPRIGMKQYGGTLPLAEKEVVLTFDDGPYHTTTPRILDALAQECVRATFFLIGRNAAALPHIAARTAREGHSIANHTYSHPWTINRLSFENGVGEVDRGFEAIRAATGQVLPWVRFPGFVETPALLAEMSRRNVAVWGTDLWASDWNVQSPQGQLSLILGRLERLKRGVILFHDTKEQTAQMLPAFLRELKRRGYRVVHVTG
jgi:peptidoglycan/xylan/chitin deacetylase (PgdA/CDA1 family)